MAYARGENQVELEDKRSFTILRGVTSCNFTAVHLEERIMIGRLVAPGMDSVVDAEVRTKKCQKNSRL